MGGVIYTADTRKEILYNNIKVEDVGPLVGYATCFALNPPDLKLVDVGQHFYYFTS